MDVLALDASPSDTTGEGRLASVRGAVDFRSVHFAYGGRPDAAVLRGLSLRIHAGSSVALVGASGSGKTTAVALLLRLYEPTSGA
jgi:ABC-type multidrug transport system fused ATPase/permease subunit